METITYLILTLLFYVIPMIIALIRGHRQTLAISVTNIILGWTIVGWIVALIWSCTAYTKKNDHSLRR